MSLTFQLSLTEARRLARLLHSFRLSLAVCDQSAQWRNVGDPATTYSLDDIILIEDVRSTITEAADEACEPHFSSPFIVIK